MVKYLKNFFNGKKGINLFLLVSVVFIVLYSGYQIVKHGQQKLYESAHHFEMVKIDNAYDGNVDMPNTSTIDFSQRTRWQKSITHWPGELFLNINKQSFNKIFIGFDENQRSENFIIEGRRGNEWLKLREVTNYSSYYVDYFKDGETDGLDQLKITFNPADNIPSVTIKDIIFYKAQSNNFLITGFNLIFTQQRSLSSYFFYCIIIFWIVMLSGSTLLTVFEKYFKDDNLKALASLSLGMIFLGFIGLLMIIMPNFALRQSIIIGFFVIWIIYCLWRKSYTKLTINRSLFWIMLAFSVFFIFWTHFYESGSKNIILTQTDLYYDNTPTYDLGYTSFWSDQIVPDGTSKIFYYKIIPGTKEYTALLGQNSVSDRTQLFPAINLALKGIFGDRFLVFESLGIVLMMFLPLSVFVLANYIFNKRIAYFSIFFIFLNYYLLYLSRLTQMKYVCIIFLNLMIFYLIKYRRENKSADLWLAGISAGISMLLHNFTIVYIIAGAFYISPNPLKWIKDFSKELKFLIVPGAITLFYAINSLFLSDAWLVKSVTTSAADLTGWSKFVFDVMNRYYNFIALFYANPAPLLMFKRLGFYRLTLTGSLTLSLAFFALVSSILLFQKFRREISCFVLLVTLMVVLTNGIYTVFGIQLYMVGFFTLLIALGAYQILKMPKWVQILVCIFAVLEWLYVNLIFYDQEISQKFLEYYSEHHIRSLILMITISTLFLSVIFLTLRKVFAADKEQSRLEYIS